VVTWGQPLAGVARGDFVLSTVQGSGQFTITVNKSTTGAVTVAYFVISAS
jgi:hypothetical protein